MCKGSIVSLGQVAAPLVLCLSIVIVIQESAKNDILAIEFFCVFLVLIGGTLSFGYLYLLLAYSVIYRTDQVVVQRFGKEILNLKSPKILIVTTESWKGVALDFRLVIFDRSITEKDAVESISIGCPIRSLHDGVVLANWSTSIPKSLNIDVESVKRVSLSDIA